MELLSTLTFRFFRIESPVARTVAQCVDNSSVGTPVILLLATADLVVTAANGVLYSFVAGGYGLKITSANAYSAAQEMMGRQVLEQRESERRNNALTSSWVELEAGEDNLPTFEGFQVLSNEGESETTTELKLRSFPNVLSSDDLQTLENSLLSDPSASVCIVPVRDDDQPVDELIVTREDATRLLQAMNEDQNDIDQNDNKESISMMSSSVMIERPN